MNCAQALGIAAAALVMVAEEPLSTHIAMVRARVATIAAQGESFMTDAKAQARCAIAAQRAGLPRL